MQDEGNHQVHTLLLVDLDLDVVVDAHNDQIAQNVEPTDAVKDIWVLEGHPLGDLHHTQDDDKVRTRGSMVS